MNEAEPTTDTVQQTSGNEPLVLKVDRLGRVKMPADRREALLREFDCSGMSGQAFAKWAGIKYPTFATWMQQRRKGQGQESRKGKRRAAEKAGWVEIVAADKVAESTIGLVVELPGGGRAVVESREQAELVGVILRRALC